MFQYTGHWQKLPINELSGKTMNLVEKYLDWYERVIESKPKYVWQAGVLGFGVPFGFLFSIALVNSNDIANHPLWEKVLTVIGMTLIGGPVTGWIFGQLSWALKPVWSRAKEQELRKTQRIDALAGCHWRVAGCHWWLAHQCRTVSPTFNPDRHR